MTSYAAVLALPTADRVRAHGFYRALGFATPGDEIADDGVPEPLRVVVNDGLTLMLIPTGGFGMVVSGREVATPGASECLVSLQLGSTGEVDAVLETARDAGADIVAGAEQHPWGYLGLFADPDGHLWQAFSD